jgi:hypothetical protein
MSKSSAKPVWKKRPIPPSRGDSTHRVALHAARRLSGDSGPCLCLPWDTCGRTIQDLGRPAAPPFRGQRYRGGFTPQQERDIPLAVGGIVHCLPERNRQACGNGPLCATGVQIGTAEAAGGSRPNQVPPLPHRSGLKTRREHVLQPPAWSLFTRSSEWQSPMSGTPRPARPQLSLAHGKYTS